MRFRQNQRLVFDVEREHPMTLALLSCAPSATLRHESFFRALWRSLNRARILIAAIIAASTLSVAGLSPAQAEKRVALVIGNAAYRDVPPLANPANDATAVAAALKRTGFETIGATDLDQRAMEDATIRFARAARTADVALFYYSGHALQFNGINYLAPVDTVLTDEADLRKLIRVDQIVADLQQAKNLRILVLDSCRDDPFAEQLRHLLGSSRGLEVGKGLAKIEAPQGMILAYATQSGHTASDGTGKNSPYTTAFLKNIEKQDEIGDIFRDISTDVYNATGKNQLPELSLSMIGRFYLNGAPTAAATVEAAATPPATVQAAAPSAAITQQAALVPAKTPAASADSTEGRAERGDAVAQNELGMMYRDGRDVAQDDAQAASWFRKAADQGNADAQANLGKMYWNSRGVARDDVQALYWFRKAADQGNIDAWNGVGLAYFYGRGGVPVNSTEALQWFRKAAERGHARAQANVGLAYGLGQGVARDYIESANWFRKSAEQGFATAQFSLGVLYEKGEGVPRDYSQAVAWYRKAADQGHGEAQSNLAALYAQGGQGVRRDYAAALSWYHKSATQGVVRAQHNLAVMYENGQGVARNRDEAIMWYQKAAEQGFEESKRALRRMGVR